MYDERRQRPPIIQLKWWQNGRYWLVIAIVLIGLWLIGRRGQPKQVEQPAPLPSYSPPVVVEKETNCESKIDNSIRNSFNGNTIEVGRTTTVNVTHIHNHVHQTAIVNHTSTQTQSTPIVVIPSVEPPIAVIPVAVPKAKTDCDDLMEQHLKTQAQWKAMFKAAK